MEIKLFFTVFTAVFIAELGDKTQLATMLFSTKSDTNKWIVFAGASAALILTSALGVLAGQLLSQFISEKVMNYVAGAGFLIIGAYMLWTA